MLLKQYFIYIPFPEQDNVKKNKPQIYYEYNPFEK